MPYISFQDLADKPLTLSGAIPEQAPKTIITKIERDVTPAQEVHDMKRISRLNSCITDKDPSLLPQNDATYSDYGNEHLQAAQLSNPSLT